MGPDQKIIEEEFEQSEDVVNWQGGSTDFSFDEDISEKVDLTLAKANLMMGLKNYELLIITLIRFILINISIIRECFQARRELNSIRHVMTS